MTVEDRGAEETGEVAVEIETETGIEIETDDPTVARKDLVGTAEWKKARGKRPTTTGAYPGALRFRGILVLWGGPHWPPPETDTIVSRARNRRFLG